MRRPPSPTAETDLRAEINLPSSGCPSAHCTVPRPRITQLLHLLKLPDEAQEIIFDLPPIANGCPISERALRPLLALDDPAAQIGLDPAAHGHERLATGGLTAQPCGD